MTWLVVALAGGVGAALRYGMTVLFAWAGRTSVWATFWTNVIGGFLVTDRMLGMFKGRRPDPKAVETTEAAADK